MLLANLLKGLEEKKQLNLNKFNPQIKGISYNSKEVFKDYLFVAIKGKKFDGHAFLNEAIKKGAALVVIENKTLIKDLKKKINFIVSKDSKFFLSKISSNFFKNQPSFISAVTGTNGKTSVAHITKEIWKNCKIKAASIGTLGLIRKETRTELKLTTVDSVTMHRILDSLYKQKIKKVCIEASSHGLEQKRIDNIKFKVAALTNISHDHLDYHKNLETYIQAKMRLFKDILFQHGTAVINSDLKESKRIEKICKKRKIKTFSYGYKSNNLKLVKFEEEKKFQKIYVNYKKKRFIFKLPLFGDFQVYNALCSIGIVISSGISLKKCLEKIEKVSQIPGRLEKIIVPKQLEERNVSVFIDYAHTPDALEKVLKTLRKVTINNLSVVFGCGGDRDIQKRPLMGRIANKLADKIYITDDNPRNESPKKIRKHILANCFKAKEISNRYKAIKISLQNCQFGETLLIAGKGHEDYQIIGKNIKKFNDKKIILKILKNKIFH